MLTLILIVFTLAAGFALWPRSRPRAKSIAVRQFPTVGAIGFEHPAAAVQIPASKIQQADIEHEMHLQRLNEEISDELDKSNEEHGSLWAWSACGDPWLFWN
ncbi:MAG: hypothetical protein ACYC9L_03095 [Sulfuricaulis sp.]